METALERLGLAKPRIGLVDVGEVTAIPGVVESEGGRWAPYCLTL